MEIPLAAEAEAKVVKVVKVVKEAVKHAVKSMDFEAGVEAAWHLEERACSWGRSATEDYGRHDAGD